uniref:F-box containing Kelch repeat 2 n=1 Tax=Persicaria minor TaxID=488003 RepID=A0A4D6EWE6_9CARY|nr:F-box containing Kelch repeat 2 [Persicaria minor]
MTTEEFQELIPGFPDEVAVECLARCHYSSHHHASAVSCGWRHLFRSPDFHRLRQQSGRTRLAVCLVQAVNDSGSGAKMAHPPGPPAFALTVFDPTTRTWERVDSLPNYPDRLPLFCHITSWEGKLILMGGWDPDSYNPVTDVFIYDFRAQQWARGRDMPSRRSLFAIGSVDGWVVIAGGHDESKNALDSAWAYKVDSNEWVELARMAEPRDECHGLVVGPELWVVSGYETGSQGGFKKSADVLDTRTGRWRSVEDAWDTCQSPRACVGVGKGGRLFNWARSGPEVRVETCAVEMGDRALVSGSERYGAPFGFYMAERRPDGEYGEMKRMDVPDQFKGFVQSACCVEL